MMKLETVDANWFLAGLKLWTSSNPRHTSFTSYDGKNVMVQPVQGETKTSYDDGNKQEEYHTSGASGWQHWGNKGLLFVLHCKGVLVILLSSGHLSTRGVENALTEDSNEQFAEIVRLKLIFSKQVQEKGQTDLYSELAYWKATLVNSFRPNLILPQPLSKKEPLPQLSLRARGGVRLSTSASGSQPSGNTKNDRILQTPSRLYKYPLGIIGFTVARKQHDREIASSDHSEFLMMASDTSSSGPALYENDSMYQSVQDSPDVIAPSHEQLHLNLLYSMVHHFLHTTVGSRCTIPSNLFITTQSINLNTPIISHDVEEVNHLLLKLHLYGSYDPILRSDVNARRNPSSGLRCVKAHPFLQGIHKSWLMLQRCYIQELWASALCVHKRSVRDMRSMNNTRSILSDLINSEDILQICPKVELNSRVGRAAQCDVTILGLDQLVPSTLSWKKVIPSILEETSILALCHALTNERSRNSNIILKEYLAYGIQDTIPPTRDKRKQERQLIQIKSLNDRSPPTVPRKRSNGKGKKKTTELENMKEWCYSQGSDCAHDYDSEDEYLLEINVTMTRWKYDVMIMMRIRMMSRDDDEELTESDDVGDDIVHQSCTTQMMTYMTKIVTMKMKGENLKEPKSLMKRRHMKRSRVNEADEITNTDP
ncbi:hypothetical protein Tco_0530105 [Tanacetum coccineum]